jgi:uncharacterized protein (DUF111 family)
MTVEATGFGAGSREIDDLPNLTQVVLGRASVGAHRREGQPVVLVEANVDDASGETLSHAVAQLLEAGAHDAWLTPIVMKKGRPAYTVSALSDPALAEQVARTLVAETGTLGTRGTTLQRWPAARTDSHVSIEGHPVRVKVSPGRVKVEHDDAARAARLAGLSLREVLMRAEAEFPRRGLAAVPDDDEPMPGPGHRPGPGPGPGPDGKDA